MVKRFSILFSILIISVTLVYSQCTNPFNLGPDTSICVGQPLILLAPNTYDSYSWQNGSSNPLLVVSNPGTYFCTTTKASTNELVFNGNFEQGNAGFSTSYTYYPIADVFGPQASYGIVNNPNTWFNPFNACTDHTSGSGQMMVIDGSAFNGGTDAVWCQNISVQSGVDYKFSYWIQSVTNSNILANIQVQIDGLTVATDLAPLGPCTWQVREIFWTSSFTGMASFCLYDLELAGNGNDFALDDISLVEMCTYSDTIVVSLSPSDTVPTLIEICIGDSVFLQNEWQTQPGFYYDLNTGSNCNQYTETEVRYFNIDTSFVQATICSGDSLFLSNNWQTQPDVYYDLVPATSCDEVLATELFLNSLDTNTVSEVICDGDSIFLNGAWQFNTGTYYDRIHGVGCDEIVETILQVNPLPIANAGSDLTISYEQILTLEADDAAPGAQFLWSSSNNLTSTNQGITVEVLSPVEVYYLQVLEGSCASYDTVLIYGIPMNLGIWVPNAFTPNSDGINDVFKIINSDEFKLITIKIYNRWGELIFYDEGTNPIWTGDYEKGENGPNASYVYDIEGQPYGDTSPIKLSGTLTLIR